MQMQNAETLSPDRIREFLNLSREIEFTAQNRAEVYAWVQRTLVAQEYARQGKKPRGTLRAYIKKVTGLSLPRIARLVRMCRATGILELKTYRRRRFARKYTGQDITLLGEVDRAHERLSGPATRCIVKREYERFGKRKYARLAGISIAHLYNLRNSARYRRQAAVFKATRPGVPGCPLGRARCRSANGANRTRKAGPASCAWTRCTKAIGTQPRAYITSMPSTR